MHQKAHQSICVVLCPSRIGGAVAIVLHVLAVLAALAAPDPWLAAVLVPAVLASVVVALRNWRGCQRADGLRAFGRDATAAWWLETCAGQRLAAVLDGLPLVSQPLVALSFRADGRRWDLALLPDSAAADDLRRLRAALRTGP